MSKNKYWLSWIQKFRIICVNGAMCLFQSAITIKIQLKVLVLYKVDIIIIISLNATCSCHYIAEKLFIWGEATTIHSLT